jgi:16S rRNA (uracil1498-N3)-methyltransferase
VAEPGGRGLTSADTTIAIGPEGGWSDDELSIARDKVSLGPHILRVETAAVAAIALSVALPH